MSHAIIQPRIRAAKVEHSKKSRRPHRMESKSKRFNGRAETVLSVFAKASSIATE